MKAARLWLAGNPRSRRSSGLGKRSRDVARASYAARPRHLPNRRGSRCARGVASIFVMAARR